MATHLLALAFAVLALAFAGARPCMSSKLVLALAFAVTVSAQDDPCRHFVTPPGCKSFNCLIFPACCPASHLPCPPGSDCPAGPWCGASDALKAIEQCGAPAAKCASASSSDWKSCVCGFPCFTAQPLCKLFTNQTISEAPSGQVKAVTSVAGVTRTAYMYDKCIDSQVDIAIQFPLNECKTFGNVNFLFTGCSANGVVSEAYADNRCTIGIGSKTYPLTCQKSLFAGSMIAFTCDRDVKSHTTIV